MTMIRRKILNTREFNSFLNKIFTKICLQKTKSEFEAAIDEQIRGDVFHFQRRQRGTTVNDIIKNVESFNKLRSRFINKKWPEMKKMQTKEGHKKLKDNQLFYMLIDGKNGEIYGNRVFDCEEIASEDVYEMKFYHKKEPKFVKIKRCNLPQHMDILRADDCTQ